MVIEPKSEDQVRTTTYNKWPVRYDLRLGGQTRVILSRPASSQQIGNARPINVSFVFKSICNSDAIIQRVIQSNVQQGQQTIVRQQPTHTVIQRSQPIQQSKVCLLIISSVFLFVLD